MPPQENPFLGNSIAFFHNEGGRSATLTGAINLKPKKCLPVKTDAPGNRKHVRTSPFFKISKTVGNLKKIKKKDLGPTSFGG
jgi:hypothetical protein